MNPKEVDFDANCERIVAITQNGLFTIWDFNNLRVRVSKDFKTPTTRMVVVKRTLYAAICFDNKFVMLDISDDANIHEISSFTEEFNLVTSEMKLNLDENFLAVAMAPNYETCTNIEIYTIDYDEKKLIKYHTMPNLSSSIEYMDFSSDSFFLMYMDNIKTRCFFELKNKRKEDKETLNPKYDVEWIGDGLKISEKIRGLAQSYTEDNDTTCLVRAGRRSLIASDQIGTVIIF